MINLILCGGSGTRLWPISRDLMPKQFVKLFDDNSLFQNTVKRNRTMCEEQVIISNEEQYFLALDQLEELEIDSSRYVLEPAARNTAPAIALACLALEAEDIVLVSPSDHVIKDQSVYEQVLKKSEKLAEDGYLVTFGITPTSPVTGYGYIEAEGDKVNSFKEKPDLPTAQEYISQGNYYWNSGMFCFKAGVFLDELKKYSPQIFNYSKTAMQGLENEKMIRVKKEKMMAIPADSIDYAVMEKSELVKVVPSDIGWNDLGSFDSLYNELPKDGSGNAYGLGCDLEPISLDSTNSLIIGSHRQIAVINLNDIVIVDTPDALLVTDKGQTQKVKKVVQQLKDRGSELHHIHQTAHRPWGTYTVLEAADNYKIKRIVVRPGARLSLQKHYHRNEHWIVAAGTGIVTIGKEEKLLRPNESTYIAMGEVHRLENAGKIDLVLIEVQMGDYLGEDDIIRLKDDFHRN
ncbi:MAG: mannose-1-phosphate guanylyltransferase/mannose-6-phosphate isomerase [Proteobacteria bacterium]|nr:mannose-1-phosphate guanylyltransferase/mannose-6-phosphate isomerase [Pseudomonadota bacterium]